MYALDVGNRTIYVHADSFEHAGRILLEAVDVILGGMEEIREIVAVTPEQLN